MQSLVKAEPLQPGKGHQVPVRVQPTASVLRCARYALINTGTIRHISLGLISPRIYDPPDF
eukprot:5786865-Pleurochrysis_carterae.AAC.1